MPHGTLEIVIQEVLWSTLGCYSAIWSLSLSLSRMLNGILTLTNIDFSTDQPFHKFHDLDTELDLHLIMSGFRGTIAMGVAYASREGLPFRTPGSVPRFGTWLCSNCWDQISRTCHVFTRLLTFQEYPSVLSRFCFGLCIECIYEPVYDKKGLLT